MPLQATSGAASYDAFGGGVPVVPNYIEDVFSCFLYTGNSSTQTITNGIDLLGKGGLVWCKDRTAANGHDLSDTARGFTGNCGLTTDSTAAATGSDITGATSSGFTLGNISGNANYNGDKIVSWTLRKQPKFFDIQTWTGTGSNTTISHSLGSVPACIMVKRTDTTGAWQVYHRSLANTEYLVLNTTAAKATGATRWNSTTPTSAVFSLGTDATVNASGGTYVAYIFAHDAGGFGLTGTDNVISCGSYTGTGAAGNNITLGYEPQWVMLKRTDSTGGWFMHDVMRGMPLTNSYYLTANTSGAETEGGIPIISPTATGFQMETGIGSWNASGDTYIYIAIRRGPMKVPTSGTSVFAIGGSAISGSSTLTTSFPVDAFIQNSLTSSASNSRFCSRLQGSNRRLVTSNTDAEAADSGDSQFGGASYKVEGAGGGVVYGMQRAPSFFDEICYTGTGSATTVTHNLGVVPELMIVKKRNTGGDDWYVYSQPTGNQYATYLNLSYKGDSGSSAWNSTSPTSSVFSLGASGGINGSGSTFVAYLFATCAGVSKVFSYTGNGSSQTINCGFTGGARFILIKRTDSTGDWYVWDSARGIVSGNDPHLSLNTTAAEVTSDDTIDTDSTGFVVNQLSATNVNVSSATYIGLAVA